jgi:flagellar hook protein FlgE
MSIYGAMFSGVSGLFAQSQALGTIGDNISNVNTVGYKAARARFSTLVTESATDSNYTPGGVRSQPMTLNNRQGLLQSSDSSTDIAIAGSGFFVVNTSVDPAIDVADGEFLFTRAGSFTTDKDGYLLNTAGFYLVGWPTNQNAQIDIDGDGLGPDTVLRGAFASTELKPVKVSSLRGVAEATSLVGVDANLPSTAVIGDSFVVTSRIFDSLGNSHNVNLTFTKTTINQWSVTAPPPPGSSTLTLANASGQTYAAAGILEFTGNPAVAETMNINGQTFTFVAAVAAQDAIVDSVMDLFFDTANAVAPPGPANFAGNGAAPTGTIGNTMSVVSSTNGVNGNVTAATVSTAGTITLTVGGTVYTGTVPIVLGDDIITGQNITLANGAQNIVVNFAQNYNLNGGGSTNSGATRQIEVGATTSGTIDNIVSLDARFSNNGSDDLIFTQTATGLAMTIDTFSAALNLQIPQPSLVVGALTAPAGAPIVFSGTGTPTAINIISMNINGYLNGANNSAIQLDLGTPSRPDGLTQFAGDFSVTSVSQNGARFGNFTGVQVDEFGVVMALFDNGLTRPIYRLPVATFPNPNGLTGRTGNVFAPSDESGNYWMNDANQGGAGKIAPSALEASTVDLANEFTTMIITQRAYSANAKVITTGDEMLEELLRVKR